MQLRSMSFDVFQCVGEADINSPAAKGHISVFRTQNVSYSFFPADYLLLVCIIIMVSGVVWSNFKYSRWRQRLLSPSLIFYKTKSPISQCFLRPINVVLAKIHVLGFVKGFEKYWMYRCYGNYNKVTIYVGNKRCCCIKSERDGKIGKIATNVKNTFSIAQFFVRTCQ